MGYVIIVTNWGRNSDCLSESILKRINQLLTDPPKTNLSTHKPSHPKSGLNDFCSLKFLNIFTMLLPSLMAYTDESLLQTNSWADPKLLFLNAIAVYMMYSPSPQTHTNLKVEKLAYDLKLHEVVTIQQ